MRLLLDVGNSAVKWRLCGDGRVAGRGAFDREAEPSLPDLATAPRAVWVASVAGPEFEAELAAAVWSRWRLQPWFARSTAAACGVSSSYDEPQRLGVDRWLAMIAAWRQTGDAVCVVDAGSALTIDFLDAEGVHRGGYIIPGLGLMEHALLRNTDRVRFDDAPPACLDPGRSTAAAVRNGLRLAQVGAIEAALARYGRGAAVLFTGGDGAAAQQLLGGEARYCEDLVLDGLACLGEAVLGTHPGPP